jgi:hypothetical protein
VAVVGLVWGGAVVADSPQFSTIVTEVSDPQYVGTALTMQVPAAVAAACSRLPLILILLSFFRLFPSS